MYGNTTYKEGAHVGWSTKPGSDWLAARSPGYILDIQYISSSTEPVKTKMGTYNTKKQHPRLMIIPDKLSK